MERRRRRHQLSGWQRGELVLRREIVHGRPWLVVPVYVVEDSPEHLVSYLPEEAPFGFIPGDWPTPDGKHPWADRESWAGHGTLMVQRPGESYAVWHFWTGDDRRFACWYVNLQEPFRRTERGYDTQDLELDIVVAPDRSSTFKDWDLLATRVTEGRFTEARAEEVRALGLELSAAIARGDRLWDDSWASWVPDPAWRSPAMPAGWDAAY
jgi:hypothetical protein